MLDAPMAEVIYAAMRARLNIIFAGGTNTGKTTFARAAARAIDPGERLITIEDAYELALSKTDHPNMVVMQSREANIEGAGEYDIARGVRGSLRLTPDRVIVGEVRGAEVVQMAKAMSIGIDGSMATVHASSSGQAFLRLITYAMEPPALYPREAATASIAGAVHVVIHLDLAAGDGTRVISSVREVTGSDGDQILSNEIYRPGPDRRAQPATMWRTETLDLLAGVGVDAAALLQTDRW
jgi:Flp pilus assembly CpaF family ATPase